jgi:hypothetical protein
MLGPLTAKSPTNTFPVISWELVAGATSYAITRLDTATGITKTYSDVTASPFTDPALKPGGPYDAVYTYTVTPIAGDGDAGTGASASVQYDTVAPGVPTSLAWAAKPTGTCGAGVTPETLIWAGVTDADHHVVVVGDQSQDVTGTSANLCWDTTAYGSFSASVAAVDSAGNEGSSATSPTLTTTP